MCSQPTVECMAICPVYMFPGRLCICRSLGLLPYTEHTHFLPAIQVMSKLHCTIHGTRCSTANNAVCGWSILHLTLLLATSGLGGGIGECVMQARADEGYTEVVNMLSSRLCWKVSIDPGLTAQLGSIYHPHLAYGMHGYCTVK